MYHTHTHIQMHVYIYIYVYVYIYMYTLSFSLCRDTPRTGGQQRRALKRSSWSSGERPRPRTRFKPGLQAKRRIQGDYREQVGQWTPYAGLRALPVQAHDGPVPGVGQASLAGRGSADQPHKCGISSCYDLSVISALCSLIGCS